MKRRRNVSVVVVAVEVVLQWYCNIAVIMTALLVAPI